MSQILCELFLCGFIINSTYWRCTHLVQSFSVVFLYCGTTTSYGGDSDLQEEMDQRKRRRMISNRESARRSRMRKQKHLNDLMTQLSQLRNEINRVMGSISMTTQRYMSVEAENSVLRAQVAELSYRLRSLNEIMAFTDTGTGFADEQSGEFGGEFTNDSLSYVYTCQPILASAEMIMY
ncbi:putative transcription factor bZIP family [Helianthus annuus]|uniref:Putative basic-leucine zipper domain-containing protein n=1 Tax=Helianthus annuus TaxID=4232 RepID=A0A251V2W1_HELAN|nr:putative transcription factor bZIP family [Helianthus annuus]